MWCLSIVSQTKIYFKKIEYHQRQRMVSHLHHHYPLFFSRVDPPAAFRYLTNNNTRWSPLQNNPLLLDHLCSFSGNENVTLLGLAVSPGKEEQCWSSNEEPLTRITKRQTSLNTKSANKWKTIKYKEEEKSRERIMERISPKHFDT